MQIPGYDLLEELSRNDADVFYRARSVATRQDYLIKTPLHRPIRPAQRDELEHELKLRTELGFEGIARALEVGHDAEGAWLVLEDRGLQPLARRLERGRPDLEFVLSLGIRLCDTLAELHRRDLVLSALSPSNVLVGERPDEVLIGDVGLMRRLPIDPHAMAAAIVAAGGAAYMAPEQTGRINRRIDHRADLYALGATLYEALTGRPPFETSDTLELVHAHIARAPVPPSAIDGGVPEQVSRIVLRLLAKGAEDRYQSAPGVKHDLERCRRAWRDGRDVRPFDLGERDASDRLLVPQRLYGRDRELAALMRTFDETLEGRPTLLLVSGYSGVGKTAFITELCKPIARQRGYFVAGKFDQVTRDIPYGAVIQAFRSLVWQVLAESEERLTSWRRELAAALGANGGVVCEVIPEVELLVGKQPPLRRLDATERRNRFRYAFQAFVGTFAQPDRPLVLFLDDLQWADPASLELVQALAGSAERRPLLVIGAYRDNEVAPDHPLLVLADRLDAAGTPVRRLTLDSLDAVSLVAFLRDTLRDSSAEVEGLGRLILEKTDGNPFFVIQFLQTLHHDRLLAFDHALGRWTFRLEEVAATGITDNVVDLMTHRIARLSPGARQVLRLAACIGNPFAWQTFLTASRQDPAEAAAGLREALDMGLVRPATGLYDADQSQPAAGTYAFLHDRVQQAAYALIPEPARAVAHLDVGRLLLAECGAEVPDARLFEIVTHLNLGRALIDDPAERLALARLDLAAGRKAKLSVAHGTALSYLEAGISLCAERHWQTEYALVFALHLEACECRYLVGQFDAAETELTRVLARAATPLDKAAVHGIRISFYENRARYAEAVQAGRDSIALFGVTLPADAADVDRALDAAIDAIDRLLAGRTIGALVDLPVMTDEGVLTAMRLLTLMWAPTYILGNQRLTSLISATMVRLSLAHGNTEDSAYGYVTHAITVGPVRRDYRAAYEWGELALAVNERFEDAKHRAKIHQQIHAHVKLWRRPFDACIPHAREARRSGLEAGDFAYAGYGAATESWPALLASRDLDHFVRDHTPTLAFLEKINVTGFRDALRVMINWALALQGRTAGRLSLSTDDFDEQDYVARYETAAPLLLTLLRTAKLHLALVYGDVAAGVEAAQRAREGTIVGTIWPVLGEFWGGLALAAACDTAGDEDRRHCSMQLDAAHALLAELAENCPENYRCFALLVAAERARIGGRPDQAVRLFEDAITYARLTDNVQQQALANELCARMLLARGETARAARFLEHAYRAYGVWGATGKLHQMRERYGGLLSTERSAIAESAVPGRAGEPGALAASLDAESVLRVAQAIAGEIELDGLLRKLMTIAIENAGAARGVFLWVRGDEVVAEAEAIAQPDRVEVQRSVAWADVGPLAHSVVRYVRRTRQDVVIGDATTDERFANDAKASGRATRSVVCVPVSHQGRLEGILYLEHDLSDAFTADRTEMLRVVAAQAAIALENARLYEEMKREVARRTAAERSLRDAMAELEGLKNRLQAENVYLQEEIGAQHSFNEIVGRSPVLLEALRKVERVATTESTVLILGETGSGKELFARAVHSRSARSHRALVKVNCGAIPPGLVESELFGHVKGAFTGAVEKRTGRFELADGGTIFLDEVGELPLDAQVKLLRVLQEREFEPVGSSRTVRVDARVIAASNRNLEDAVREGRFRDDLLYRLDVFPIAVPPLRERPEDIRLLIEYFLVGLSRKLGKPIHGFSARSLLAMQHYAWPGNVRELQNVVERAAILASGPMLEFEPGIPVSVGATEITRPSWSGGRLDDVQREHILSVLKATNGVVEGRKGAAVILGMHPNTLRSRMKKLGISAPRRPLGS